MPLEIGDFSGSPGHQAWSLNGLGFVGDDSNQLLRYVSSDEFPAASDWPLVLYGPGGTGKTSLALSIGSSVSRRNLLSPENGTPSVPEPAIYLTSADFVRRFQSACETNSISDFRKSLLECQCLVIDDVQHLANRQFEQLELIHLLDLLDENCVPVVMTCNQFPLRCSLMSQLASRMTRGLCLAVQPPGKAARVEIIRGIALQLDLSLTDDAVVWMAETLPVNVPRIKNILTQLATTELPGRCPLDAAAVKRMFAASTQANSAALTKKIIHQVADEFYLKPAELTGSSRKQTIVSARSVAIYFCRKYLKTSFLKIGKSFGGRDHSTVMHACQKIENVIAGQDQPGLNEKINRLDQQLAIQITSLTPI